MPKLKIPRDPNPAQNFSHAWRYPEADAAAGRIATNLKTGGAPMAITAASTTTVAINPTWPAIRRRAISAGPMLHTPGRYVADASGVLEAEANVEVVTICSLLSARCA